jgi:type VI protein secretion system component Hcp
MVGPLLLNKASDGCSPALFQLLVDGSVLDTVTLVDNKGKVKMFLKTGRLSQAQLRDPRDPDNTLPTETIALKFDRIAITWTNQQQQSKTVCWDNVGKTSRCAL